MSLEEGVKAGKGRVFIELRILNVILRGTEGFLAEEKKDQVCALVAIWRIAGEV